MEKLTNVQAQQEEEEEEGPLSVTKLIVSRLRSRPGLLWAFPTISSS